MGSEARARIGLAGLLVITLMSFSQVFQPGDYPGPALLGMLVAAAITMGARRLGIGTGSTFVLSAVALVFYLSFIFANQHTLWGLPTIASVDHLIQSVEHVIDISQIDYAPVPVRTGYVIMLVAGLWAATTVGEVATFRWKRPLIASFPVVALFAVVMIVGTGRAADLLVPMFLALLLTYWGLESSHRLRSWGRWVPSWPGHAEEDEPSSVTAAIARRMGAMCVVTALLAPLFLPAIEDGLLAWRTGESVGGPGSGGGSGGSIDPLVSIAPTLLEQSNTRLFTVRTDNPSYWRLVTLTEFNGEEWHPGDEDEETVVDGVVGLDFPTAVGREEVDQTIQIENLEGDNLPAAVQAIDIELEGARANDLRFAPGTGDLRLDGGVNPEIDYVVTSEVPAVTYRDLLDAEPGDLGPLYEGLPEPLSDEAQAFRDVTIAAADRPYEELVALQARLRGPEFEYDVNADADVRRQQASTDHLTAFLTETRAGFCQQFATAFAVLSRSLGYPTRVVVGFLPGESSLERTGEYVVKGTDAHAWPEVYFREYGWIPFEPTPRVDRLAPIPAYTLPGGASGVTNPEGLPSRALGNAAQEGLGSQFFRGEQALINSLPTPGGLSAEDRAAPRAGELGGSGPRRQPVWARTFTRVALVIGVLAFAFFALVPALKEWQIRRRYKSATDAREQAAAAFYEFLLNAGELASPKGPAESARAYARRIAATKGLPDRSILRLAAIYEASEYAQTPPDSQQASEARKLAREMRSRLWGSASWWNRLLRLFSPRALRLAARLRPVLGLLPFVRSS
jgi:hypothetical protein